MNELAKNMRERVLETLTLIADGDLQLRYQQQMPSINVSAELFNQWDDCFFSDDDGFRMAFDLSELDALNRFDAVIGKVCAETPQQLPKIDEFQQTVAWRELSVAATATLLLSRSRNRQAVKSGAKPEPPESSP